MFARRTVLLALLAACAAPIHALAQEEGEEHEAEELEAVVVTATRSEQRIEDAPVRVEVLAREEVEEKMMMTPGDVSMMLNETSGLRVQVTSPSLGGANVRVQGLRGRYTQILSDGLPLYGGQSGSLGLLQIPPMDLGQVEVIKGAASALYGASALGGVVNLVSRRPADDRELLLNATTLGGADAVLWTSGEMGGGWGYTFLGGAHGQRRADVDDDAWADLPRYTRGVVRPRLFWDGGEGRSLFVTVGATAEDRAGGGTLPSRVRFAEELRTRRGDAGLVGRWLTDGGTLLNLRASVMGQRHDHTFGDVRERDRHGTAFGEVSAARTVGAHTLVAGAALQRETYRARDVEGFDYTFTIPSLFAQDDWRVAEWLALTGSGRADWHSEYGVFFSPRVSALVRPAAGWSVRASAGGGYYAPTPFTEETEAIGLTFLRPLRGMRAERARGVSLDVGRALGPWELNAAVFGSVVDDALRLVPVAPQTGEVVLVNMDGETRTWGTEALVRYHAGPWHVTGTYTWTRATEPTLDVFVVARREVPLTPRHQAGIVGMWEAEGAGRVGVELYYTGRQALDDNPYRADSRPYAVVGLLAEKRVGRARVFVNAENLADARQTRWDPLVLPARSPELRWTTDAWAPLEGRVVNAGVRLDW
ncbi:TonB-dependent receptor plug domain-containing protein [Longimicrobium sp.]|uniref:TonB-dependent receptor plug domain-containing protein n=1 Tax=Longimicrobium sp. TaxID=2029185 RepID=UPI002E31BB87|nr:TonB-dependent receptor [Longimicrobium sp.]HEX6039246.1 TonB-dependent receptor [Longimicrobium sp.]